MARRTNLAIREKNLTLPTFLPDATLGYVRAVDSRDLESVGIAAVVMNTFHLMQKPGSSTIQAFNGLHRYADWPGVIITDSGGFQAYSLIHQSDQFGTLTDKGIIFRPEGKDRKFILSPEKSIQLQFSYDSDVVICLDDCTHVDASREDQELSVTRTLDWAKRCKTEYDRQINQRQIDDAHKPLIFGVIQGGGYPDLRRKCAEGLLEIGFDGYGYGGWPLDGKGNLLTEIVGLTRELVPEEFPMHALGIGHPPQPRRDLPAGLRHLRLRPAHPGCAARPLDAVHHASRIAAARESLVGICLYAGQEIYQGHPPCIRVLRLSGLYPLLSGLSASPIQNRRLALLPVGDTA